MSIFSRNSSHRRMCGEQKETFQTISVIIFWKVNMFKYKKDQAEIKRNVISSKANLVYELAHQLLNDLRLSMLGNKETFGKSEIWMETQDSALSVLHKLNFSTTNQKRCKSTYQTFLVLCSFSGFANFVSNFLTRILNQINIFWRYPNHH